MPSPSIAHYGTTIIEVLPPAEAVQREIPHTGDLAGMLRLLTLFGFEPLIENMYPGMGRQYIRRRGKITDPDYIEFDAFTSYTAIERPATDGPRVGDTIFRITHHSPVEVFRSARREGLVTPVSTRADIDAFELGDCDWILVRAPNGQCLEIGPTQPDRAGNHTIYVWTDPDALEATALDFTAQFHMQRVGSFDFHGLGKGLSLRRARPGITIGLITPLPGHRIEPRWSDDIFREAGYSHYRMGSPDKGATLRVSRQAFPDGGDVSFVYFRDSYLELVQVHDDDPAMG